MLVEGIRCLQDASVVFVNLCGVCEPLWCGAMLPAGIHLPAAVCHCWPMKACPTLRAHRMLSYFVPPLADVD